MKKFFSIFILLIFYSQFALLNSQSFSVTPFFGYVNGQLDEILYRSKPRDNQKISLLEWEKKIFIYGADVDFKIKNFHTIAGFSTSIHGGFGEMRDSDWLNTTQTDMKTTYSVGDIKSIENYNAELTLKYDMSINSKLKFSPIVSAQYSFDSFERGKNAEGWYGQSDTSSDGKDHWWYEDEAKHYPTEYYWSEKEQKKVRQILAGIDYYRHSFYTFLGFGIQYSPFRDLNFNLEFLLSPFTYTSAKDTHHSATYDNIFYEIQYGYLSRFKLHFGICYDLTKQLALNFLISSLYGATDKGDLFDNDWHLNKYQPSGASIFETITKLGLKVKFF